MRSAGVPKTVIPAVDVECMKNVVSVIEARIVISCPCGDSHQSCLRAERDQFAFKKRDLILQPGTSYFRSRCLTPSYRGRASFFPAPKVSPFPQDHPGRIEGSLRAFP